VDHIYEFHSEGEVIAMVEQAGFPHRRSTLGESETGHAAQIPSKVNGCNCAEENQ